MLKKKCNRNGCPRFFLDHKWGRIKTDSSGWFHSRDNKLSWCPNHIPGWVTTWHKDKK